MILACGEALIDMVPIKDKTGLSCYVPCPGGSPYNTAIALGRILGNEQGRPRTAFLSRLSWDFFGEALIQRLKQNDVSTELTVRSNENTTLAFVKLTTGEEPSYLFYTERSADRSFVPADIPPVLPDGTDCILFGSISLAMEPSATTIEGFIAQQSGREGGPVISHDPNVRPLMIQDQSEYLCRFEKWVRSSTLVKISSEDLDYIYPGLGPEEGAKKILALGPVLVIVTLRADGAVAFFVRGGMVKKIAAAAFDIPIIDTIGAGDAFHGALLAWLEMHGRMSRSALAVLDEDEIRNALIFANKTAAIVCSRKGADPPTFAEVEAYAW
ncbi:MAG: carbohydrate kinase [Treponema sp.]|nr:carbohydrate kinase [Treponema sp.]